MESAASGSSREGVVTVRPPAPPRDGATSLAGSLVVRFLAGARRLDTILHPGAALIVGRDESSSLPLEVPTVSRRHARLVVDIDGRLTIEDLESANGTSVTGRPVRPGQSEEVSMGDVLRLGDVLGTAYRGAANALAPISSSQADFEQALEAALELQRSNDAAGFAICGFEGEAVASVAERIRALVVPSGRVLVADARRLVCLLRSSSNADAGAWARVVAGVLSADDEPLVPSVVIAPRDGTTTKALLDRVLERGASARPQPARPPLPTGAPLIGARMRPVFDLVRRVATTTTSVLILGETGAGKEVVARTIHGQSARAKGPFVALNCAALPELLLEGELFGYERGAFTGAAQAKAGLIESANGGTLFLDELGELPLSTQSKLLRVLEDRAVLRLGSLKPRDVDVRLLAATNRNIKDEIAAKRFRADLYYRLAGLTIHVPPLRERREEIDFLVDLFARRAAEALDRPTPRFTPEVMDALRMHAWPGNVRELRNAVDRLVLLSGDGSTSMDHLPDDVRSRPPTRAEDGPSLTSDAAPSLASELAEIERARVLDALRQCAGNQTRAAKMLGITRRVLVRRLERYGVPRPRRK